LIINRLYCDILDEEHEEHNKIIKSYKPKKECNQARLILIAAAVRVRLGIIISHESIMAKYSVLFVAILSPNFGAA